MSAVLPVTGAGEADLSPGLENVGSESLNRWRRRPLLPSSEAEREDSLGRRRLDPLPAFTISLTHRDVEPGLEDVVDGDRALDAGRRAMDAGGVGDEILCCREDDAVRGDNGELEGSWLGRLFRACSRSRRRGVDTMGFGL